MAAPAFSEKKNLCATSLSRDPQTRSGLDFGTQETTSKQLLTTYNWRIDPLQLTMEWLDIWSIIHRLMNRLFFVIFLNFSMFRMNKSTSLCSSKSSLRCVGWIMILLTQVHEIRKNFIPFFISFFKFSNPRRSTKCDHVEWIEWSTYLNFRYFFSWAFKLPEYLMSCPKLRMFVQ